MRRDLVRALAAVGLAVGSTQANATWSILIADTKTGEIALGSATCLTGFDLRENTPVVVAGLGAATAQSFVDGGTRNRSRFLKGLIQGDSLDEILQTLSVEDNEHQTRQYGFVSTTGEALTFTGTGAGRWAGGVTGVLPGAGPTGGDLHYAIQGNVLAGEPVVLEAEIALIATSGPLSDRLMAAMEAARDLGGDGRCSCDTSPADSCGSPPDDFEKSADIGYVIVARPGDVDACRPFYPQDEIFRTVAAQRVSDGEALRLAGGSPTGEILRVWDVVRSETGSRSVAVETAIDLPGGASMPFVGFADVDGNDSQDLVAIVNGEIVVYPADASSGAINGMLLTARSFVDVSRASLADLDDDGAADQVGITSEGVWISWNDAGSFGEPVLVAIEGTPVDLDVLPPAAGGGLVVINSDDAMISVLGSSPSRDVVVSQSITGEGTPRAVTSGDVNGDGIIELVYVATDNQLRFVSLDGSPVPESVVTVPFAYDVRVGDFSGDDGVNEVLIITPGTLALVERLDGELTSQTLFTGPSFGSDLADLDGDGRDDFVGVTSGNARSLYVVSGDADGFDARLGCGNGDYLFSLNVADQQRSDPDPVDQLRDLYDAQRASLVGVTDAIASEVFLSRDSVSPSGLCESELIVSLADLDGEPVVGLDPSALSVELLGGPIELGAFEEIAPSVYAVEVLGIGEVGAASLRVFVDDASARLPVRLAPDISFEVRDLADVNGDGAVLADDFQAWLDAYQSQNPRADQNLDGRISGLDFGAWLGRFNDPCR